MASPFRIVKPDPKKPFIIGRSKNCDLILLDRAVSRCHAKIEKIGDDWIIENLSQTTGTYCNHEAIEKKKVKDGDIFLLGVQQIRTVLKNGELSLLHICAIEDIVPIPLSETEPLILGRRVEGEHAIVIEHPAAPAKLATAILRKGRLEISFFHWKKIFLSDSERIKLPWCLLEFRNDCLYLHQKDIGFEVCVQDANVVVKNKELLKSIHFALPAGEILAVIGRSGQGKSTLLRLFTGKHKLNSGSVTFDSINYDEKRLREQIAFLTQDPLLRDALTVSETIRHTARITLPKDYSEKEVEERLQKFTELFGLNGLENHSIATLSGGEKRRVALTAQLMGAPGLILLDEPLSGLDPVNSKTLCTHLRQLAFLGHTVILTTHSYEALQIADKVLVLHQGEQGFFGTPQEALHYFNTNNAESILQTLNDQTGINWEASGRKVAPIGNTVAHTVFPKVQKKEFFLYFLKLLFHQWFRDRGRSLALLLQPLIIGFLLSQTFTTNASLWIAAFSLILCANWFALSLSIREVVQEKELLLEEFRQGMGIHSVLFAKMIFPLFFSFLQTLLCYLAFGPGIGIDPPLLPTLLTLLSTLLPAVTIGLLVSTVSKNSGQANAYLPLLIIPQVALAGALVPIDQMGAIGQMISRVIWSKYNQSALQNLFTGNNAALFDILIPLGIALVFYIITLHLLHQLKKAK